MPAASEATQTRKNLGFMSKLLSNGSLVDRPDNALQRQIVSVLENRQLAVEASIAVAIEAVPIIAQRWVKIAFGKVKRASVGNEIEAGRLLMGLAGVHLEPDPSKGFDPSKPAQEMSLDELDQLAARMVENVAKLRAVASDVVQVSDSDTDSVPQQDTAPTVEPAVDTQAADSAPSAEQL